jgi:NAD-dependent DNA ligase
MSWQISLDVNTLEVPIEAIDEIWALPMAEEYWYEKEEILYEGRFQFNPDHMEWMGQFMYDEKLQEILTKYKANGKVILSDHEGDNRGTWWGWKYTDGVMEVLGGKTNDLYQREDMYDTPLGGKTIVFTGKMERMTRTEAKDICESIGMHVASTVSGNTDFLVNGSNIDSKKAGDARTKGVKVISEEEFMELIEDYI